LGRAPRRRRRRAARHEHGPAVGALLGAQRQPVEIVVLELVRVDRARAVLGLHRAQGAAGLVGPRLLTLEFAGLASTRLGSGRESASLEWAAVSDLACDERYLGGRHRTGR